MIVNSIKVKLDSIKLTDEQFYKLCQDNRDLRFERNASGDMIIMPPTGGETGDKNSEINYQVRHWNKQYKLGKVFDSSTGFKLPNGADRSPDSAWIPLEKWNSLTSEQRQKFVPFCPDFVIELRFSNDNLKSLQNKMKKKKKNGTRLGWLINRKNKQVDQGKISYLNLS